MIIVGLDLSLASTGVATPDGTETWAPPDRRRKPGEKRSLGDDLARLDWFRARAARLARELQPDLVVIEEYAFSSVTAYAHALGELGGVVKNALWLNRVPIVTVGTSVLKRYACGNGRAKKPEVTSAVSARTGIAFPNDDECDAWVLRQMALARYTPDARDCHHMPASHRVALGGVAWPTLDLEGAA